jgi:hypothetical protein
MMNYRPISLPTSFSKVAENAILVKLFHHIKRNNVLSNQQFGLRSNSAAELASFNLTNEILKALNNNVPVTGIFCD